MLYEHGRGPGDEIQLQIDRGIYPLVLPEPGANGLYRWPLTKELASDLSKGKSAGVVVDRGARPSPIALAGSSKSIQGLLQACGAPWTAALAPAGEAPAVPTGTSLTGLSDNTDCVEATSEGAVVSREMDPSGQEIEGFTFRDDRFGESYINVSLPEAMSQSRKASVHARLREVIQPSMRLRMILQGCGAAARIEVVSSITAL